ncbi:hypothetical protein VTK26DRAFT_4488 [Humicola hyalothermophila]
MSEFWVVIGVSLPSSQRRCLQDFKFWVFPSWPKKLATAREDEGSSTLGFQGSAAPTHCEGATEGGRSHHVLLWAGCFQMIPIRSRCLREAMDPLFLCFELIPPQMAFSTPISRHDVDVAWGFEPSFRRNQRAQKGRAPLLCA